MTRPHDAEPDAHQLLGAFVLGGLSAHDHQTFTTHLRTCATCQRETAQLSGLSSLLALVDPATLPHDDRDPLGLPDEATAVPGAVLHAVRRHRLRNRWLLAAAAVVLAIGGVTGGLTLASRLDGPGADARRVTATGPAGSPTSVQITLVPHGWGTELDVQGRDLPTSGVLYLQVTDRKGRSWELASWSGVPSGRTSLSTACWVTADAIRSVAVVTRDGTTVAQVST